MVSSVLFFDVQSKTSFLKEKPSFRQTRNLFFYFSSTFSDENRFQQFLVSPTCHLNGPDSSSSIYSIDWGINVKIGWNNYLSNFLNEIKEKTIQNLKLSFVPISVNDLIRLLESFSKLQYLDIDSSIVENEDVLSDQVKHNLKRLRIRANCSPSCFSQLMRYFTNLNELELDCEFYWFDSQNFFNDFTFQDCFNMKTLRTISFLKPKQPKAFIEKIKLLVGFQRNIVSENSIENEFTTDEKYRISLELKSLLMDLRRTW